MKVSKERQIVNFVKGLILDSGPGPMGAYDHYMGSNFRHTQHPVFMPLAVFLINRANGVRLAENMAQITDQLR